MLSVKKLWILVIALFLAVGCSIHPEGLEVSMEVSPPTIEAHVGDTFDITVTTTSNDSASVDIDMDHNPKGIITGGDLKNLGGAWGLTTPGGMSYRYGAKGKAVTKVTFKCGAKGETTLSFNAKFTANYDELFVDFEATDYAGPKLVQVKCKGAEDKFGMFLDQLGVPKSVANWAVARVGNILEHSTGNLAAVKANPDILRTLAVLVALNQTQLMMLNSKLACGAGEVGHTVCSGNNQPFAGDAIIVAHEMDQAIDLTDSKYCYQYGFVFDSDGDTTNNYQPDPEFPKDFFKDTDRWYEANYCPGQGWSMKVTDARDGQFKTVASAAPIVMLDNTAVLVVPAHELAVSNPAYRVEVFKHTGDYGMTAPYDWSGDVEPSVDMGLLKF